MSTEMTRSPGNRFHDVPLYAVDETVCAIDVSDNTNLWGAPPAALRTLRQLESGTLARYPEVYSSTLKAELGRYVGFDERCIVTGSGSDDVLDCAFRAFGARAGAVAIPSPTFSAIPSVVTVNDLRPIAVPLASDGDVDVERTLAVDARIIYLCSPNNPTGALLSRDRVTALVEHARGVVIIDEAYAEFTGSTLTDFARSHDNVFVTRTFSKAFGLAGLRLGYGLGAAGLVASVEKARGPYKVNVTAERVAVAVMREDLGWVRGRVDDVVVNRETFVRELERIGVPAMPSRANFVLVPVVDAQRVAEQMRTHGVAVRAFSNLSTTIPVLAAANGNALRISIGPQDVMSRVLEVLGEAIRACA